MSAFDVYILGTLLNSPQCASSSPSAAGRSSDHERANIIMYIIAPFRSLGTRSVRTIVSSSTSSSSSSSGDKSASLFIGNEIKYQGIGMVLGNIAILLVAVAVNFGVAAIVAVRNPLRTRFEAAAKVYFPSIAYIVVDLMYAGIAIGTFSLISEVHSVNGGVNLLQYSSGINDDDDSQHQQRAFDIAVATIGMIALVAMPAGVLVTLLKGIDRCNVDASSSSSSAPSSTAILPSYRPYTIFPTQKELQHSTVHASNRFVHPHGVSSKTAVNDENDLIGWERNIDVNRGGVMSSDLAITESALFGDHEDKKKKDHVIGTTGELYHCHYYPQWVKFLFLPRTFVSDVIVHRAMHRHAAAFSSKRNALVGLAFTLPTMFMVALMMYAVPPTFIVMNTGTSSSLSTSTLVAPSSSSLSSSCEIRLWIVAAFLLIVSVIVAIVRPHRVAAESLLYSVGLFLLALLSLVMALEQPNDDDDVKFFSATSSSVTTSPPSSTSVLEAFIVLVNTNVYNDAKVAITVLVVAVVVLRCILSIAIFVLEKRYWASRQQQQCCDASADIGSDDLNKNDYEQFGGDHNLRYILSGNAGDNEDNQHRDDDDGDGRSGNWSPRSNQSRRVVANGRAAASAAVIDNDYNAHDDDYIEIFDDDDDDDDEALVSVDEDHQHHDHRVVTVEKETTLSNYAAPQQPNNAADKVHILFEDELGEDNQQNTKNHLLQRHSGSGDAATETANGTAAAASTTLPLRDGHNHLWASNNFDEEEEEEDMVVPIVATTTDDEGNKSHQHGQEEQSNHDDLLYQANNVSDTDTLQITASLMPTTTQIPHSDVNESRVGEGNNTGNQHDDDDDSDAERSAATTTPSTSDDDDIHEDEDGHHLRHHEDSAILQPLPQIHSSANAGQVNSDDDDDDVNDGTPQHIAHIYNKIVGGRRAANGMEFLADDDRNCYDDSSDAESSSKCSYEDDGDNTRAEDLDGGVDDQEALHY